MLFFLFNLVVCLEHFEQAPKRYVSFGVLGLFGCSAVLVWSVSVCLVSNILVSNIATCLSDVVTSSPAFGWVLHWSLTLPDHTMKVIMDGRTRSWTKSYGFYGLSSHPSTTVVAASGTCKHCSNKHAEKYTLLFLQMAACVHDLQHGCCASAGPAFGWVLHGSLTLPDYTRCQFRWRSSWMAVRGHEQNPTDSMDYPHTLPQPSLQQVVHANTAATNTRRNPALLKKPLTKIVYRDTMIRGHCLVHNSSFEIGSQLNTGLPLLLSTAVGPSPETFMELREQCILLPWHVCSV